MASRQNPDSSSDKSTGRGGGLINALKQTAGSWLQDNAMRLSAALSLYTILSLAPLLVLTIKVISLLWRNHDIARNQIMAQMSSLMGSQAAQAIGPMLDSGSKPGSGLMASIISTLVLIFSATGVFVELQDSMNTIWGVKPKPNAGVTGFIRNRLLSVGMVFGLAFLLLVSMFVSTALETVSKSIFGDMKLLAIIVDVIVSFGVVTVLFAAIFKFMPDVKLMWKHVWVAAVLTAILFTVGKYGLTIYFKYGSATSAFGAAGSLAAVLLWVYYSSFILFFGAEFSKIWAATHGHPGKPAKHAVKVTEDERAKQGIPSRARMQTAISSARPPRRIVRRPAPSPPRSTLNSSTFAALAVGTVLGGLLTWQAIEERDARR